MTILHLFPPPDRDAVIFGDLDGWKFHIAYVTGVGECPHHHRLEAQAERCMRRMRHWIDYQERRANSGLQADGTVRLYREGPGPRPTRRP